MAPWKPWIKRALGRCGLRTLKTSAKCEVEGPPTSAEVTFNVSKETIPLPQCAGGLAKKFSSGMMDEEELRCLAASVVASRIKTSDIIVEIGSYVGLTAVFLSRILDAMGIDAPILSIDPFERVTPTKFNPQGSYKKYLKNIEAQEAQKRCMPLVAFSRDAHRVVPDRIGLLIVDGDHSYHSAKSDLELYWPKVRKGGIVFVDDYGYATYPGVSRAIDEFFDGTPCALLHKAWFAVGLKRE